MRLDLLLRPTVAILLPVLASLCLWAVPGESLALRGFNERADVTALAVLVVVGWYAWCVVAFHAGSIAAMSLLARRPREDLTPAWRARYDGLVLRVLTVIASIGIGYTVVLIVGTLSVGALLSQQRGNELFDALPGGSSVATLRYASIVSAPIAIYLWRRGSAGFFFVPWNCALLVVQALLTSRLSLIAATVVALYLFMSDQTQVRIRWRHLGPFGAVLLGLLTVLNYVRNANYYRAFGVENPLVMNFYQIATYVGAPFQAQLGVANGYFEGRITDESSFISGAQVLIPTFLQSGEGDKSAAKTADFYQYTVDLAPNLNTNSVLADTTVVWGWSGLLWALAGVAVIGCLFRIFSGIPTVTRAGAGVVLYCLFEMWRLYLLSAGVFVFVLLSLVVSHVIAGALIRTERRRTDVPDLMGSAS